MSVEEFPPDWLDAEQAITFLRRLRPKGPWCLAALYLPGAARVRGDTGRTVRTFVARRASAAREFIAARNGVANLHYVANPLRWKAVREKPSEALVTAFSHPAVDVDCDKGVADGEPLPEVIDRRKAEALERLSCFDRPCPPGLLVDSGGGIQALWKLVEPKPITGPDDLEDAKAVNRALVEALDGDPACVNPCHLMRLPGTVNLPGTTKLSRGRIPAPARWLR